MPSEEGACRPADLPVCLHAYLNASQLPPAALVFVCPCFICVAMLCLCRHVVFLFPCCICVVFTGHLWGIYKYFTCIFVGVKIFGSQNFWGV